MDATPIPGETARPWKPRRCRPPGRTASFRASLLAICAAAAALPGAAQQPAAAARSKTAGEELRPVRGPANPALTLTTTRTGSSGFTPVLPTHAFPTADRPRSGVASSALWTGALAAIPGVALGATIDRKLLGDEYGENPGLAGAIAGGTLGFGVGGILGAHRASGGKGDIRLSLGALGVAAIFMAVDLEAGLAATFGAVNLAIAIET